MAADLLPVSFGTSPAARVFFGRLTGESWYPPSALKKKNDLDAIFNETLAMTGEVLKVHAQSSYVAVDSWSSKRLRSFAGVAVSFITAPPHLQFFTLTLALRFLDRNGGVHSGYRLAQVARSAIVRAVQTYNASLLK